MGGLTSRRKFTEWGFVTRIAMPGSGLRRRCLPIFIGFWSRIQMRCVLFVVCCFLVILSFLFAVFIEILRRIHAPSHINSFAFSNFCTIVIFYKYIYVNIHILFFILQPQSLLLMVIKQKTTRQKPHNDSANYKQTTTQPNAPNHTPNNNPRSNPNNIAKPLRSSS